mgnify:CR=1 FL=1
MCISASEQAAIDQATGPAVSETASGPATIETYTVMHDREGPSFGILFGRLHDGSRFIANTPEDIALLREMEDEDYIGAPGKVAITAEGLHIFTPD